MSIFPDSNGYTFAPEAEVALFCAELLASRINGGEVTSLHLLYVFVDDFEDSAVGRLLQSYGITKRVVEVEFSMHELGSERMGLDPIPGFDIHLRRVFDEARALVAYSSHASQFEPINLEHLLYGISRVPSGLASSVLHHAKLDHVAIRREFFSKMLRGNSARIAS